MGDNEYVRAHEREDEVMNSNSWSQFTAALDKARAMFHKTGTPRYVVCDHADDNAEFAPYAVATEEDVNTFYQGCTVCAVVED
jgi:glucuronate isomerase